MDERCHAGTHNEQELHPERDVVLERLPARQRQDAPDAGEDGQAERRPRHLTEAPCHEAGRVGSHLAQDRHRSSDHELAADPDADGEDVKRETDSVEGERQHRRRPYEIRPPERPGRARWFA